MKVLNFGSMNINIFFKVSHIVRPGETISARSIEKRAGGKGLNQSVALARLNKNVYHAGNIGIDGKFLLEEMENLGIDTSLIRSSDKLTGNAIIQVDDKGENSIVLYKGANFTNSKAYVDEVLSHFGKDDILVLQNEINYMAYIIDRAYQKGMKIVLNPSPITDAIDSFNLSKIDLLLANETEAEALSSFSDRGKIVEYFRKNYPSLKLVMTLGKNGSMYFDAERMVIQRAYDVCAIDSTGAGDTFAGFFINNFYKGEKLEKCLEMAAKASALSVTKKGASASIPSLDEVIAFKG